MVGAGPVGMCAALFLARSGISVTVLESGSELSSESRASTFHPPTLEMLDEGGVVGQLLSEGLVAPKIQWRDRQTGIIAEFDFSLLEGETKYPYRLQIEQSRLTRIVYEQLKTMAEADVRFRSPVRSAMEDSGRAKLVLETGRLNARYVVVSDGAHSAIRKSLDIPFEGVKYPDTYLVGLTHFDFSSVFPDLAHVNYVTDPKEWALILRTPNHWRATFPSESELQPRDVQRVVSERIRTLTGGASFSLLDSFIYEVHQRIAKTFRQGPLLLAGDAAHVNNPMGGLGMNSGIHDAYFLAKQLVRILRDGAPETLLDDYSRVRRRIVRNYVNRQANENWLLLRETDESRRRVEQQRLKSIASDPELAFDHVMKVSMLESVRSTAHQLG